MESKDEAHLVEEWYAPLGEALSQGDIVDVVPSGLIDAPLTICQPNNTSEIGKSNYWPYEQLPKHRGVEFIHAKGLVGLGMVIWPDCQIDKLKNQGRPQQDWFVGIAPVHPITRLPLPVRSKVTELNRAQYFPLPPNPPSITELSYVDLRYIWSVRFSLLKARQVALTEVARQALAFHLFWFLTEVRGRQSVPCPHCAGPVDAGAFFQFKDQGEG